MIDKNYLLIGLSVVAIIALLIVFIPNSDDNSQNNLDQDKNCRYENILEQGTPLNEWIFVGNDYWNGEKEVVGDCKDCLRDLYYSVYVTNFQENQLKFKVKVVFSEGETPQEKILTLNSGQTEKISFIGENIVYTDEFGGDNYVIWNTNVYFFDDIIPTYTTKKYVCDK